MKSKKEREKHFHWSMKGTWKAKDQGWTERMRRRFEEKSGEKLVRERTSDTGWRATPK